MGGEVFGPEPHTDMFGVGALLALSLSLLGSLRAGL